jgi:putative transposase
MIYSFAPVGATGRGHGWRDAVLGVPPPVVGSFTQARPGRGEGYPMPGTYSQILLHIIFSTKRRSPWITPDVAERLYPYMGGIVRAEKGVLYEIGGIEDHVHMYLRWRTNESISDLMRTVKSRSSKWIHDTFPSLGSFSWQEGYAVFSVSKSQEKAVKNYIAGQAEHHKKEDFKSELLRSLRVHGIEFDEKYLFD